MSETLGSLVDELSIVNLKLWHVQDEVFKASSLGRPLDAVSTQRLVGLNLQRNRLMTKLDELLDSSIKAGKADVDMRPKLG